MSFDWIEFSCAESLLDEPTEFICGCGGDIVQRLDEEDFFCWVWLTCASPLVILNVDMTLGVRVAAAGIDRNFN